LKIALVGSFAQVGLAFATAIGAWINLSLVIAFAVRARYLHFDAAWIRSLAKFVLAGVVLGAALWLAARLSASYLSNLTTLRDEVLFLLLIATGSVVYAAALLLLFGKRWVMSLVRG
jgi:putative peptidoglycan lipid II flippase